MRKAGLLPVYVINWRPYKAGDVGGVAFTWAAIWNGFFHRDIDQLARRMVALVPLGDDPERADAFRELKRALRSSATDPDSPNPVLNPAGCEWAIDDKTYQLAMECLSAWRRKLGGADNVEEFEAAKAYLTPEKDGPTRKLTQEERDREVAERTKTAEAAT